MSEQANLPDLIISLSHDKVMLDLSALPEEGRNHWKTTFGMEGIFLEEKISRSIDEVLLQNPVLIDQFPCVDVVVVDRPHVAIPKQYVYQNKAASIAAKYLRLRAGDFFTSDFTGQETALCYTLPATTVQMFREYYSNITITHLSSLVWQHLSVLPEAKDSPVFFCLAQNSLMVLAAQNGRLSFSKNFIITSESDALYYSIACRRLLKPLHQYFITIQHDESAYDLPGDTMLNLDGTIELPSLHELLSQFKACGL